MAGIFGQLESAQLENLASDPANAPRGRVYYNTTTQVVRYYNGTTWLTLESSGTNPSGYTKYVGTGIGHYATLNAAIAAAVAGDRILNLIDTTSGSSITIPMDVCVEWWPGKFLTFTGSDGLVLSGRAQALRANVQWTGGASRVDGVGISGMDAVFDGLLIWASTGTLTNAFNITGARCRVSASVRRDAGAVTNLIGSGASVGLHSVVGG